LGSVMPRIVNGVNMGGTSVAIASTGLVAII
jgi:hypothetical protein